MVPFRCAGSETLLAPQPQVPSREHASISSILRFGRLINAGGSEPRHGQAPRPRYITVDEAIGRGRDREMSYDV